MPVPEKCYAGSAGKLFAALSGGKELPDEQTAEPKQIVGAPDGADR